MSDFADWVKEQVFEYANEIENQHIQAARRIRELEDMLLEMQHEVDQLRAQNRLLRADRLRSFGRIRLSRQPIGSRYNPLS